MTPLGQKMLEILEQENRERTAAGLNAAFKLRQAQGDKAICRPKRFYERVAYFFCRRSMRAMCIRIVNRGFENGSISSLQLHDLHAVINNAFSE